ncbi:MAG: ribonuclease III [Hyphomicrobiales bacterium]|nr:ribonuclease III [Hyphomicrobiales bacterium]MCY4033522.1 ribonuclease III [Hyphomicrobiales bacterium]MCY4038053.1 ribonuclease III [Hyphomicrobiales bacterium]
MVQANEDLDALQERIGWRFKDVSLLRHALIHRSAAPKVGQNNERMEFLGDRVLGLLTAYTLYQVTDEFSEGELALRLNAFVKRSSCSRIAETWNLWDYVNLGRSERNSASERSRENILADAFEAVLGAVFIDGGLDAANAVVEEYYNRFLETSDANLIDPKTQLQEWLHKQGGSSPVYRELKRRGSVHAPVFTVEVDAGDAGNAQAEGTSKRRAERQAAHNLLLAVGALQAQE